MMSLDALETEYKISQDQVEQFQQDGHILLRKVCSIEELKGYRTAICAAVDDYAKTQEELSKRNTYGKAFLQLGNLWQRDKIVKQFVYARRFAQIAAKPSRQEIFLPSLKSRPAYEIGTS